MSNGKYKSKKQLKKEGLMTSKGEIVSEGTYKQSKAIKKLLSSISESVPRTIPKHLIKKQLTSITPNEAIKKTAKKLIKTGFTPEPPPPPPRPPIIMKHDKTFYQND